ncbi:AbrB/MazE/SpoVT family DNA-binding domain-containing protein [Candidatus Woesearchaeota archaeon]|nr:AbrB/MazE/SpoVT family DNA-binding domain-containing protein [Candidatus Woesearchaeota archaeon]
MKPIKSKEFPDNQTSGSLTCPICRKGKLTKGKSKEYLYGVYLGEYDAQICTVCHEIFLNEESVKKIEKKAKEKGIWGLGKKTKITKSGNSIAIRISKELADYLKLEVGREAFIHPENKRIIIEPL